MFLDYAIVHVRGGKGGNGCVSFRRERYVPRGGPNGGDGGKGGDVIFQARVGMNTLHDIPNNTHYAAGNGKSGAPSLRTGHGGGDVLVPVPPGTIIRDHAKGVVLRDLVDPGDTVVVAKGGVGGKGNKRFASATDRAPKRATQGQAGEERIVELELKLIADIGLIGLPNAGKSTMLSRLSNARPKIASYEFTTLEPQLGIMETGGYESLVLADIPGLIEGAHAGAGLGGEFLKHIERTRALVHLVDVGSPEPRMEPAHAYEVVRSELAQHSGALAGKPELVVATKMDLTGGEERLKALQAALKRPVLAVSAVTGDGLEGLRRAFARLIAPEES